jgi:hypothetical protein
MKLRATALLAIRVALLLWAVQDRAFDVPKLAMLLDLLRGEVVTSEIPPVPS